MVAQSSEPAGNANSGVSFNMNTSGYGGFAIRVDESERAFRRFLPRKTASRDPYRATVIANCMKAASGNRRIPAGILATFPAQVIKSGNLSHQSLATLLNAQNN
jgi:hypothetical protein